MYISLLIAAAAVLSAANAAVLTMPNSTHYINYTTVTGYFLQDEPSTNASAFDYTATNFGLISRTYPGDCSTGNPTQWQRFARLVETMNNDAPLNTVYKVLFMGRHGEGYHNAAQTFYGTPAWNCYWAELDGNATVNWSDAHLTPNGVAQAQIAHDFWAQEFATQHIPAPQSYYTSPLSRCLETANVTFHGLQLPQYYPFIPTVKEFFRESISIHTCDRRSNKTYIHATFPSYKIEAGFTEYDELWNGITAETDSAQQFRSKIALDDVFTQDDHTWLSITSHSGEIGTVLEDLHHQSFGLNTGAVIPVLVKAQFLPKEDAPATSTMPWTLSATCNAPPITSLSTGASTCVCSTTAAGSVTSVGSSSATSTSPATYT